MLSRDSQQRPPSVDESASLTISGDLCDAETAITEMTFLPDGRICLFGASREVMELLGSLQLGDTSLDTRIAALRIKPTNSPVNSSDHD